MKMLFANRLKMLRSAKFSAARHFAEALDIPENRYTRYERGAVEPDIDLIYKICKVLAVTPNELFGVEAGQGVAAGFASERQAELTPAPPAPQKLVDTVKAEPPPTPGKAPPKSGTATPQSAAIWQLAETVAGIRRGANGSPATPLAEVTETARWYTDLASEPYGALARIGTDPAIASLSSSKSAELAELITAFVEQLRR